MDNAGWLFVIIIAVVFVLGALKSSGGTTKSSRSKSTSTSSAPTNSSEK